MKIKSKDEISAEEYWNFHEFYDASMHQCRRIAASVATEQALEPRVIKATYTRAHSGCIVSRSFQIQRAGITYFLLSPPAVERNRIIAAGKINTGEVEGPEEQPSRERVLRMS